MELKTYFAQDVAGNIVPGATVTIYFAGTTNIVTGLAKADGSALSNPFTAESTGRIQFRAPDGLYDMSVKLGNGISQVVTIQCVDYSEAKEAADLAHTAQVAAENAADKAENYAINAAAFGDNAYTFPDTAAGIAATNEQQYFRVPVDEGFLLYQNVGGVAVLANDQSGINLIHDQKTSANAFEFTDKQGFNHTYITDDGKIFTPSVALADDKISTKNMALLNDTNFADDELLLSDGHGFCIEIGGGGGGGNTDPGEVTVDLPPQTAAYGLLSKMRSALDDVCIIINSDSTGITQDTDPATGQVFKKWTRKLAEFLAANYPAYTVVYYSWGSGAYNAPETIQTGTAGKTLYFYNAAVAGTQPLYLMGQYFEAAYVPRQADLIILNHGHNNDGNSLASTHMGMYLAIMYTMLQRHPNAGAMIVSQNPLRDNENGTTRSNGARQAAVAAGFSLIDAFQMFNNAGKPTDWYMDNIHPNATGDDKIFDLVKNFFVWPANPATHLPGLTAGFNLISNYDFSAWDSGASSPDGWTLTGCTAEKDTVNFETGSYGLKLVQNDTIEAFAAFSLPSSLIKRLKGRTVVLSARVFVPTASTRSNCGQVQIPEVTNSRTYGTPSGGRGGFVWKSTIVTVPTTATSLTVRAVLDTAGGVSGNWCTFDRLILAVGRIPQDFY